MPVIIIIILPLRNIEPHHKEYSNKMHGDLAYVKAILEHRLKS